MSAVSIFYGLICPFCDHAYFVDFVYPFRVTYQFFIDYRLLLPYIFGLFCLILSIFSRRFLLVSRRFSQFSISCVYIIKI